MEPALRPASVSMAARLASNQVGIESVLASGSSDLTLTLATEVRGAIIVDPLGVPGRGATAV